jgi:hypothetical protein
VRPRVTAAEKGLGLLSHIFKCFTFMIVILSYLTLHDLCRWNVIVRQLKIRPVEKVGDAEISVLVTVYYVTALIISFSYYFLQSFCHQHINFTAFNYMFLIFVLQPSHRKQAVLETLSEFWGDWVLDPIDYIEKNWSDETYVGGCPMHGTSPGVMGWFHHIRSSFQRYLITYTDFEF